MSCFLIRMTKLKITFFSSEGDSSHERWTSNLHNFVRHEVTEWDTVSLGTWIFWVTLPVRMLLTAFLSLVPFPLGVGPGGILCRELLTLGIPPFGWSKLDQSDSTPGSGGRHICSVWLAANRGFILGWVGERDFYVRRGFIVGWQGVASVKGGNHFSSLAECLTFVRQSLIFVCGFQDFYEGWVMKPWALLTNWTTLGK